MPAITGGAMISPDPKVDLKADSTVDPMTMVQPPGTVHPLNDPRPDPMKDKRIAAFKRKVLRNGVKEPKLKKDIPMPDNLPKNPVLTGDDAKQGNPAVEMATSLFSLSRQLFTEGRHAESFEMFHRAMGEMESATAEIASNTDAALRHNARMLLASAFDPNTGVILASAALDDQLELALDEIVGEDGDKKEEVASSNDSPAAPSALKDFIGSLNKPSPLKDFANSLAAE